MGSVAKVSINFITAKFTTKKFTIMEKLTVGMKFKTNDTPRGCYHVITETDDRHTTYETVYPNGMHPFTSGPTQGVLRWLNRPHIGLEMIN